MKIHYAFILLITSMLKSQSSCTKSNQPMCVNNDDCLSNHNCFEGTCKHRGYFPPNLSQWLEITFMSVLSTVATSAGVGGGPIYSALLMFIDNLEPQIAFPLSSFSILICSIITFCLGVQKKMNNPSMKFIDYDLAVVFCPSLLLGTRIGVIFNAIFPDLLLIVVLIVFLSFSSFKTYKNALKAQSKEKQSDSLHNANSNLNQNTDSDMIIELIRVDDNGDRPKQRQDNDYSFDAPNSIFYGVNAPIDILKVKWVLLLQAIMLLDQLLEGNSKIDSIINIKKCSFSFWLIFCCFIAFCLIFTKAIFIRIKNEANLIQGNSSYSASEDFKITSSEGEAKINRSVFFCCMAGVFSGMLGIGGGLFMAPLMLELNVNTQIATSTSNFFLIFTAFSSTCLYMLAGNLIVSYALMFGSFCGVFAYIGTANLSKFVERTKKASVLIWILLFVSILSLILLPINAITHALYDLKKGKNIFGLKSYC